MWNFNGQEVRQKVSGINEVMIGSSGRLLRFSQDENNVIRLRELENGNQFSEFATGGIYQQFSPDGRFIATAPAGDTIYIWDVNSRQN
ncbi:MAG: hypothetical protein HC773_00005 [Scytonema sp. CRU_2_7]|nr:hypothetical protein [Scytonema sp. CRU_2_7]